MGLSTAMTLQGEVIIATLSKAGPLSPVKERRAVSAGKGGSVKIIDSEYLVSSLTVQWLGFRTFIAKGTGSISGRGTKISQAAQ